MIRGMLLGSCRPDWDFATRLCSDLQSKLDEDTLLLLEQSMVRHWLEAMLEYEMWFVRACTDYSITASDLLDPPFSFVLIVKTNRISSSSTVGCLGLMTL